MDLEAFCRERLGAGVEREEFRRRSAGEVHGLRLDDGRRVVVKVHRGDLFSGAHLMAVYEAQARLADAGFPAPRPLAGPVDGVTAETLVDDGAWADAHEPGARRAVAAGLVRLVACTGALPAPAGLHELLAATARLWELPHDRRFDFAGTGAGAEWIDAAHARARSLLARPSGDVVISHSDWRVEHLRFAGSELVAVYDWDSLAVGPEPAFAGWAAHAFTADWTVPGLRCVPTTEESQAFLADYETARGAPFTVAERSTAHAALLAATAYGARCEHSDALTGAAPASEDGYRRALEGLIAALPATW